MDQRRPEAGSEDKLTGVPLNPAAAEMIAGIFHATYETLAPEHGHETREASTAAWDDVPPNYKALMIATVQNMLDIEAIRPGLLGTPRTVTAP